MAETAPLIVTLYGRAACPLCDEVRDHLMELRREIPHRLAEVDIDADPVLQKKYFDQIPVVTVTVPDGLDLADITADVLAMAADADAPVRLDVPATAPVGRFGPVAPARAVASALADAPGLPVAPRPATVLAGLADTYSTIGSNNWVVSGARSTSGKPLLANDPHRALSLPSLRYTIHLNGPGWDVIGAGEPALPGVAAGHNARVAFGFTIVGIDQQDLYVERLDPANPDRYLYKGQSRICCVVAHQL